MDAKTYIVRSVTWVLVVAACVVACNHFVDPYGISGAKRIAGFNQFKVDSNAHTRLLKKYQPQFGAYNTLIVGKSRVEMGLNPLHECFAASDMEVYNLGIPGAELPTQFAYTVNVLYRQPIENVFISVDFTDYISTRQNRVARRPTYMTTGQGSLGYLPDGAVNDGYWQDQFQDRLKSLFSLDALVSSIKTVATQSGASPDRTDRGFNPGQDFAAMVQVEGARALFDQKLGEIRSKYGRPWYFRDAGGDISSSMADLEAFLDLLIERGVTVYVFSNPLHEQFWEVMQDNDLMAGYQDWRATMTAMLRGYPPQSLSYWDFSGDSRYIHEQVPAEGVRSGPLNWFWEPSHYRRELGDKMIATMLSESCGTAPVFGRKVH